VDTSGVVKVFNVTQLQRMVVTLLSRSSSPVAVVGYFVVQFLLLFFIGIDHVKCMFI